MTEPVNPDDVFAERMRLVSQADFGTTYRPQFAQALASTNATYDDLARIGAYVRALDGVNFSRLSRMSGAVSSTTGADGDLMSATGSSGDRVEVANASQVESAKKDLPWWQDALSWAANLVTGQKGDLDLPLTPGFVDHGIAWSFKQLARTPGFIYRTLDQAAGKVDDLERNLGLPTGVGGGIASSPEGRLAQKDERSFAMTARGYDPGSFFDNIAFNWTQGEATFRDLDGVREQYGDDQVDLAMRVFVQAGSRDKYLQQLEQEYAAGKISVEDAGKQFEQINSPEFTKVYEAVDREHQSPGRDIAREVLPKDWQDDAQFTALSGTLDAVWNVFADPTIVGGKAAKSAQLIRYGLEATDSRKIFAILGQADPITGEVAAKGGRASVQKGVQDFLDRASDYRDALAKKDENLAAGVYAAIQKAHPDMMPLLHEVNGVRPAITQAEREASREAGLRATDANGVTWDAVKTDPITNLAEFAQFAVNTNALMRLRSGLPAAGRVMMPGRMGYWAERRANRAMTRTTTKLEADDALIFSDDKLDDIIGSEAEDAVVEAARLRGLGYNEAADAKMLSAKGIKARLDATSRRLSTLVPENTELRFHAATDADKVERIARGFLPKQEAARLAAMWAGGTEASRRSLAMGLEQELFHAAGLSRSTVGRAFMAKRADDIAKGGNRRYGFGDTDKIADEYKGPRRAAMYQSQINQSHVIPSFTDIKRVAARASILGYDRQVGEQLVPGLAEFKWNKDTAKAVLGKKGGLTALRYALFSSEAIDRFFQMVKLGWVATPANFTRNFGDEYLSVAANGARRDLAHGKALLRETEDHNRLVGFLNVNHWKIPKAARAKIATLDDAASAVNEAKLFSRPRGVTPEEIAYVKELNDHAVSDSVAEYYGARTIDEADSYAGMGVEYAREAHARGVPLSGFEFKGYQEVDRDGADGLNAMAKSLGQRFLVPRGEKAADWTESVGNGVLAYVMWHHAAKDPEWFKSLDEDTRWLMDELMPGVKITKKGTVNKRTLPKVDALHTLLGDQRFAQFRREAERFNVDANGAKLADDDVLGHEEAIKRVAPHYVQDIIAATHGEKGQLNADLASRLLRGDIPDSQELRKYLADLPPTVIRAQWGPAQAGKLTPFRDAVMAKMTKWYDGVVTTPMYKMMRHPLYADSYVTARKETQKFADKLVDEHGWMRGQADDVAKEIAHQQALNKIIGMVDNPAVSSQFSVMARNWWPFIRAQEDWLRRFGRTVKADPTVLRKAQLGVYGMQQAGILSKDEDGRAILTYPGSGAVIEGLMHVAQFIGLRDTDLGIPNVQDLSTRLTFLNPSLQNPIGYTSSPMVSIPWRMLAAAIPGDELAKSQIDLMMNGELGAGRSWWEQLLPSPVLRLIQLGDDPTNTGSVVGGAAASAMTNMALNGTLAKYGDTDVDKQNFIADVQTQTLNALFLRTIFAFAAPGAPGMVQQGDTAKSDVALREAGVKLLNQEFKQMVSTMGPTAAYSLWTEIHPEALVYVDANKTETSPGAHTPVTLGSADFVMNNRDFFTGTYKDVAPYFLPEAPGDFSQIAWNAMTALGVRQYRSTSDMFDDLTIANGLKEYYDGMDKNAAAVKAAQLANNKDAKKQANDDWAAAKQDLYTKYPRLQSYLLDGSSRKVRREQQIDALTRLVQDPNAPKDVRSQLTGVTDMVNVYREYQARTGQLKGQQDKDAKATRQELGVSYHDAMRSIVKKYPSLQDAYNGIFRSMVDETE